ncbi:hypothetical protein [Nocardioides donggukensis]|uniref:Uncharacterized protein n=1 Tax=Nocardioides donggukensis TaxID=2774019 RepID=A0A927Q1L7_9ACTN|nr:hypothetical protein [Nocardioides donggukensis]MBD8868861.1 hypothetical protein [Nocardioides donggukensis]
MSVEGEIGHRVVTPPLPRSIWVIAWASLAGQLVLLVGNGIREVNEVSLLVSAALGGVIVGFVSAGVVRARTGRLVLACVVLVLTLVAEAVILVTVDTLREGTLAGLSLASTAVALAGLARFRTTDWYAWIRAYPSARSRISIGRVLVIGVLVGILGGVVELPDAEPLILVTLGDG